MFSPLLKPTSALKKEIGALRMENDKLKKNNRQLTLLALTDSLTGLGNRRAFTETLAHHVSEFRRWAYGANPAEMQAGPQAKDFVLVALDINGLKLVNDNIGHADGDKMLQIMANAMTSTLRGSDSAYRLGGDEFAVILTGNSDVNGFQKRLVKNISALCAKVGFKHNITAAVGSASILEFFQAYRLGRPDTDMARELLNLVDRRMYENKKKMKNDLPPKRD